MVDGNDRPGQPASEADPNFKRRIRRALWFGRDSHGCVPFDEKDRWRQGYDAAKREVLAVLDGTWIG